MTWRPFLHRKRFTVWKSDERTGYDLIDETDSAVIWFPTRRDAEESAWFSRQYVKRHGDIDLQSFPYRIDAPLRLCLTDYNRAEEMPERFAFAASQGDCAR